MTKQHIAGIVIEIRPEKQDDIQKLAHIAFPGNGVSSRRLDSSRCQCCQFRAFTTSRRLWVTTIPMSQDTLHKLAQRQLRKAGNLSRTNQHNSAILVRVTDGALLWRFGL